jgi:hypothetical protein
MGMPPTLWRTESMVFAAPDPFSADPMMGVNSVVIWRSNCAGNTGH